MEGQTTSDLVGFGTWDRSFHEASRESLPGWDRRCYREIGARHSDPGDKAREKIAKSRRYHRHKGAWERSRPNRFAARVPVKSRFPLQTAWNFDDLESGTWKSCENYCRWNGVLGVRTGPASDTSFSGTMWVLEESYRRAPTSFRTGWTFCRRRSYRHFDVSCPLSTTDYTHMSLHWPGSGRRPVYFYCT